MMKLITSFLMFIVVHAALSARASVLHVRVATDATTLDWNRIGDAPSALMVAQIMRGLFRVDAKNQAQVDLAKSFSQKGLQATINIRSDVRWSDGRALLAQDFVDSYHRLRDPKTASPVTNFLESIADMSAPNPTTLKISLREPIMYLPDLLSHPCLFPIRRDLIDKYGDAWTDPKNLVVLGPYKITSRKIDSLTRFEPLHASDGLETIEVRVLDDDGTAQNLFEAGQLDIAFNVSPAAARKAKNLVITKVNRVTGILINTKKVDAATRRALALNTNREVIAKALGLGRTPTTNWVSPDLLPRRAGLGAESGSAVLKARLPLIFANRDDNKMVAEILQTQLHLKELQPLDFKSYLQRLKSGDFELSIFSWNAGFPNAVNFLDVFTKSAYGGFSSPAYEKAVQVVKVAGPADLAIHNAQEILVHQEHAIIPLFQDVQLALVQPQIRGYELSNGYLHFEKIKKAN